MPRLLPFITMRVAIVHDFLIQMGGAERVVEALHAMYPEAPVYTSAYAPDSMPANFRSWDIRTSFIQKLPYKRLSHRLALFLYPMAFESFDLRGYDVVISSSSAFAKGVVTEPSTIHICYTHTPMRFAWNSHEYLERERMPLPLRPFLMPVLHRLRTWDAVASARVDRFVANSNVVRSRIEKFYRRECSVVYPPVDTSRFGIAQSVGNYYLLAARFSPYKRLDLAIEACNRLKRPLKVVGCGRGESALRAIAGPTIEFVGRVGDQELVGLMSRARAYLMPGNEDFGISPVEANACGRPVLAYAAGGALDSQVDGLTGVLFKEQTVESLCAAILSSESIDFSPAAIRDHAMRFDVKVFEAQMRRVVAGELGHRERMDLIVEARSGQPVEAVPALTAGARESI